jgi:hypothetical protein
MKSEMDRDLRALQTVCDALRALPESSRERVMKTAAAYLAELSPNGATPQKVYKGPRMHWTQTPAGRKRMSKIQRERQAAAKTEAKPAAPKMHWAKTPAGRKKMAQIARDRQAARRKAKA